MVTVRDFEVKLDNCNVGKRIFKFYIPVMLNMLKYNIKYI